MKRILIILIAGAILLSVGHFTLPLAFKRWFSPPKRLPITVLTKYGDVVEIHSSNSKLMIRFFDNKDSPFVEVSQELDDENFSSLTIWPDEAVRHMKLLYFRKHNGVFTTLDGTDENGIPTKMGVGTRQAFKVYRRNAIDWIESKEKPKQPPEPTRASAPP